MNVNSRLDKIRQLVEVTSAAAGKQKGGSRSRLGGKKFFLDASNRKYLKMFEL